jgi:hypothetical protein
MPKWCRNIFVFGALTNGGHRLSGAITIAPAMKDMSESIQWRKYNGMTPSGREAEIEDVGRVVEKPRYGSLPKIVVFLAKQNSKFCFVETIPELGL